MLSNGLVKHNCARVRENCDSPGKKWLSPHFGIELVQTSVQVHGIQKVVFFFTGKPILTCRFTEWFLTHAFHGDHWISPNQKLLFFFSLEISMDFHPGISLEVATFGASQRRLTHLGPSLWRESSGAMEPSVSRADDPQLSWPKRALGLGCGLVDAWNELRDNLRAVDLWHVVHFHVGIWFGKGSKLAFTSMFWCFGQVSSECYEKTVS